MLKEITNVRVDKIKRGDLIDIAGHVYQVENVSITYHKMTRLSLRTINPSLVRVYIELPPNLHVHLVEIDQVESP